jgi:hypothetical protein
MTSARSQGPADLVIEVVVNALDEAAAFEFVFGLVDVAEERRGKQAVEECIVEERIRPGQAFEP